MRMGARCFWRRARWIDAWLGAEPPRPPLFKGGERETQGAEREMAGKLSWPYEGRELTGLTLELLPERCLGVRITGGSTWNRGRCGSLDRWRFCSELWNGSAGCSSRFGISSERYLASSSGSFADFTRC